MLSFLFHKCLPALPTVENTYVWLTDQSESSLVMWMYRKEENYNTFEGKAVSTPPG